MAILVLGAAGYIGSNMVDGLIKKGYDVISVDNLSTGYKTAIHNESTFYQGDIRDKMFMHEIFKTEKIDAVMHFAALSLGRESVENPLKYFSNNVFGTQVILELMHEFNITKIVFSSSAAIYGNTTIIPVDESVPTSPLNPYGDSKRIMEQMIDWQSKASSLNYVALRYFNVAGAQKNGTLGEVRPRLIPTIIQVVQGKRDKMTIFGSDYQTPDGTCIRDYIHILDLVEAHILALEYLNAHTTNQIFNLGSGRGYSNLEIVEAVKKITGLPVPTDVIDKVTGDADILIASNDKITDILYWVPQHSNIEEIVIDAFKWQTNFPDGYK